MTPDGEKVTLKMRTYRIVSDVIESGIACGYRRAFKHTQEPTEDAIVNSIHNEVMMAIADVVDWQDGDG